MWAQEGRLTWVRTRAGGPTRSLAAQTASQLRYCCSWDVHPPLLHWEASEQPLELGLALGQEPRRRYPGSAEALLRHIRGKTEWVSVVLLRLINYSELYRVLNSPISISSTEDKPWENWTNTEEIQWTVYFLGEKRQILDLVEKVVAYLVTWCILITRSSQNIQGRLLKLQKTQLPYIKL